MILRTPDRLAAEPAIGADTAWSDKLRRNSRLAVERGSGHWQVRKTYHSVYRAEDELQAYHRLAPLCQPIEGIRLPDIYEVDTAANSICLEYIAGRDLRQTIAEDGLQVLRQHEDALLELLAAARSQSLPFDSDPANFVVSDDAGALVLVDPICRPIDLPDYALIVFVFGILKATLARPRRVGVLRCRSLLRSFCRAYCRRCPQADGADLRRQLAQYVKLVIGWNQEAVALEPYRLKVARRGLWIPALRLMRGWLLLHS